MTTEWQRQTSTIHHFDDIVVFGLGCGSDRSEQAVRSDGQMFKQNHELATRNFARHLLSLGFRRHFVIVGLSSIWLLISSSVAINEKLFGTKHASFSLQKDHL